MNVMGFSIAKQLEQRVDCRYALKGGERKQWAWTVWRQHSDLPDVKTSALFCETFVQLSKSDETAVFGNSCHPVTNSRFRPLQVMTETLTVEQHQARKALGRMVDACRANDVADISRRHIAG